MRSHPQFSKIKGLATLILFLFSILASAQEYNFTFYNGDVIQEKKPTKKKEKESISKPLPTEKSQSITSKEKIGAGPEKLKRTGLSLIAGHSHDNYKNSNPLFSNLNNKAFRVGLSFISSYDFNLDLEFLSSSINGSLNENDQSTNLSGRVPGIAIGIRNNYWLTNSFALSLGGNIRGIKGTLRSTEGEYSYKSHGAFLSAGPTFQINKVQIQLTYEYGLSNVKVGNKNKSITNDEWIQNSALKGMLSYRF